MRLSTMRAVDRWLGLPLCWLLTGARRVRDAFTGPPRSSIDSILFIKLAEQGSTVLAADAIQQATERVGRSNVYFLVFEENRFILDVMDLIPRENVVTIETGGLLRTLARTLGALRRLRRLRVSAAIDLEFFARSSAALTFLSGAPIRVGYHGRLAEGPRRGNLMTHRLRFNPHIHSARAFRMMVDALDANPKVLPTTSLRPADVTPIPPSFSPTDEEREKVKGLIVDAVPADGPIILLNANCSDLIPLRAWPRERYVELARRLLAWREDVSIIFTGAPAEARPVDTLVHELGSPRCQSLAGKTTLRELLVLYALSDVLVTNDSGPAHFATLTPIHVVTLFGPEHPDLFASLSPRNHVLWACLACSPCVSALNNRESKCRDNLCLQAISVDEVFGIVRGILEREATAEIALPQVVTRPLGVRTQGVTD
jgi:ADP-heptose:LPS heptosyltransferase